MKLISITILVLSFIRNGISNEQFIFPPKFQTAGQFASDSSLYLPPEAHTQIPYYPLKKLNNLQFPYLPPTGTKSPMSFPPPFPLMLSSTLAPNFDDEDDDKGDERDTKMLMTSPKPHLQYSNRNRTERVQDSPPTPQRDIRPIPKMFNYQHPIDRIDIKSPVPLPNGFQIPNPNQTSRSMIISAENHRNDYLDHIRSGSSQNPLFITPPGVFISTTEPAIPIVRLSNEMDLDGSFSYEALGADQTHYVQHSHMENLGSDKAEQVVEGSYSYIGDNGQTYTVHYIADSNGFRATGDHLPVAPPIPEIIQRSIQYNLAEEAKKPQHLKSWQYDDQERDYNEISDKNQRFSVPPPRSLFTGRTPEAFSYDFSQRSNTQNLATAASSQIQMKTIADFNNNQSKANTHANPILPQVTFLASQGAHIPSNNPPSQSVSRMFTTEKSIMPQLINYEADDGNRALWRWQYGLNSNNVNQTPEKHSISRSFGEGDDVMINFSEMTPDQYSKMLQSQVPLNAKENIQKSHNVENSNNNDNTHTYLHNNPQFVIPSDNYKNQKYDTSNSYTEHEPLTASTEAISTHKSLEGWYKPQSDSNGAHFYNENKYENTKHQNQEIHEQNIDTSSKSSPMLSTYSSNQVVTQEYNFEDSSYEPKRIKALHTVTMKPYSINYNQITDREYDKMVTPSYIKIKELNQESEFTATHVTPTISTESNIKFTDFITHDNKDDFKPVLQSNNENKFHEDALDNETVDELKLNKNIFLTKLFNTNKSDQKKFNKIIEDSEKQILIRNKSNAYSLFNKAEEENKKLVEPKRNELNLHNLPADDQRYIKIKNAETKSDKIAQLVNVQNKPFNDIKSMKKKPLDISDVLNYITMKNPFESSKVRPKNNPTNFANYNIRNEMRYLPVHEHENTEDDKDYSPKQNTNNNRFIYTQPGELRGNIKNYKVLQRQNNIMNTGYDNDELKRELVPPPIKLMHAQNLPTLGRAGPSTRSYLPPTYI